MSHRSTLEAVVVGAGPNGLAAAITLARAGRSVLVLEGKETIGGGMRSAELTLPGFVHDVCSAIHPLGVASPFFRELPLAEHGLAWVFPPAAIAHPLDDGTAVLVERSVEATAAQLGPDAGAYRRLMGPLAADWRNVLGEMLGPLRFPRHPLSLARFGLPALLACRKPGPAVVPRRARPRRLCGDGGARDHAAGVAGDRRVRVDSGHPGPRGRLAHGARRLAAAR